MDIKKELGSNQSILMIISAIDYHDKSLEVVKKLKGKICYVTTNKTSDALREEFKKKKIDLKDIVIIDAISKTIKSVSDEDKSIYYVSSPGALTELDLVIGKFLNYNFDYLIFDSLNNLLVYQKLEQCTKFLSSLINKIHKTKTKSVFYSIGTREEELPRNVSMFVEKVIDASK